MSYRHMAITSYLYIADPSELLSIKVVLERHCRAVYPVGSAFAVLMKDASMSLAESDYFPELVEELSEVVSHPLEIVVAWDSGEDTWPRSYKVMPKGEQNAQG